MGAQRHRLRNRVLARARRGEFASAREIGLVASVPVQTALRWLREAKIDIDALRLKHLAKVHQKDHEEMAVRSGSPRPTDKQRRVDVLKAVRKFNERHTQSRCAVALEAQAKDGKPH